MKKIGLAVLLTSMVLSGCSNNSNGDGSENTTKEPTVQEQTTPENTPILEEGQSNGTVNDREIYINKLDAVEESLSDLQELYDEGTTASMVAAEEEKFQRWDAALNEIYAALQQQLSNAEMDKLQEEQREWITVRDDTAKEQAAKFEGGTMESLELVSVKATLTQERAYELVEQYMK